MGADRNSTQPCTPILKGKNEEVDGYEQLTKSV